MDSNATQTRYRLGRRLAAGGMAEVFEAISVGAEGFERPVVLKRILPEYARDKDFREMFIGEARIMASLSHRNIVQVLDFGVLDDAFFLAVELVDGVALATALKEEHARGAAIPEKIAATIVAEVLRGLDYAHRRTDASGEPLGIVHRDVSPDNILISREGEVKIADFGIAKTRDAVKRTRTGHARGKTHYLSPETLYGRPATPRSDIFAAGMVLSEMLAGRHPLEEEAEARVLQRIAGGDIPGPSAFRPDLSPAIAAIVARALAHAAELRYATAGEMANALDLFVARDLGEVAGTAAIATWIGNALPKAETKNVAPAKNAFGTGSISGELVRAESATNDDETLRDVSALTLVQRRVAEKASESPTRVEVARRKRTTRIAPFAVLLAGGLAATLLLIAPWEKRDREAPGNPVAGAVERTATPSDPRTAPTTASLSSPPPTRSPEAPVTLERRLPALRQPAAETRRASAERERTATSVRREKLRRREAAHARQPEPVRQPQPEPAPTPRSVEEPKPAIANINADPWAKVFIDGVYKGDTPLRNVKVRSGKRQIRFHNPAARREKTILVDFAPGERKTVAEEL